MEIPAYFISTFNFSIRFFPVRKLFSLCLILSFSIYLPHSFYGFHLLYNYNKREKEKELSNRIVLPFSSLFFRPVFIFFCGAAYGSPERRDFRFLFYIHDDLLFSFSKTWMLFSSVIICFLLSYRELIKNVTVRLFRKSANRHVYSILFFGVLSGNDDDYCFDLFV